jgi:hypothetical protein
MLVITVLHKYFFLHSNVFHRPIQLFLYTLIDFSLFINMTVYPRCLFLFTFNRC